MKKLIIAMVLVCVICALPAPALANKIVEQQARTEHMRNCIGGGGQKDICLCSFERSLAKISAQDLLDLNRALANNILPNFQHLEIFSDVTNACLREYRDGSLQKPAATKQKVAKPKLPEKIEVAPPPPNFGDLQLTIPEPPELQQTNPDFIDKKTGNDAANFFTKMKDEPELPKEIAPRSSNPPPSNWKPAPEIVYKGEYDLQFFQAAARGDVSAMAAFLGVIKNPNITNPEGNTPLIEAVKYKQIAAVNFLLTEKADINKPNAQGQTPLHLASFLRHPQMAQLLIDNGANIEATYGVGYTPLSLAVLNRDTAMMNLLLVNRANPNVPLRDGNTAVHLATTADDAQAIQLLQSYRANLNAENSFGYTPLMVAASQNKLQAANALLYFGANANLTDLYGRTAAQIAQALGHTNIVNAILTMQHQKGQ